MRKRENRWARLVVSVSLALSLAGSAPFAQEISWDTSSREEAPIEAFAADELTSLEGFIDALPEEDPVIEWDDATEVELSDAQVGSFLEDTQVGDLLAQEDSLFIPEAISVEEEEDFGDELVGVSISSLVKKGVTIYALGSDWLWDETYDVPSGYDKSYDLSEVFGDGATYRVLKGNSAEVTEGGYVSAARIYTYWNDGVATSYSSGLSTESMTFAIIPGETTIQVTRGTKTYEVKVTVLNYATYAAQKVLDSYVKNSVPSTYSEYEKLAKVADFPCRYYFYTAHDTYEKMILLGGGNRQADCEALLYLCEKAGLSARQVTYGNAGLNDPAGRLCVLAMVGNRSCLVDFMVDEGAKQSYVIRDLSSSPFHYEELADGTLAITGYDGAHADLVLPTKINGVSVTTVGPSAFAGATYLKSIKLPSSIVNLDAQAFAGCTNLATVTFSAKLESIGSEVFRNTALTSFTVPATCTYIGQGAFWGCSALAAIQVASGNSAYASLDGILYDKDYEKLLAYPAGKEGSIFWIPSTVKTLAPYCLAGIAVATDVVVPLSVQQVQENAFYQSMALSRIWFNGNAPSMSAYAFGRPAFQYNTYTVYVPKDNITWDTIRNRSYDGVGITWMDALTSPKLLSLTMGSSGPVLTWKAVSGSPAYRVYRKEGSSSWEPLALTEDTEYQDASYDRTKNYAYSVQCCTAATIPLSLFDENGLIIEQSAPSTEAGISLPVEKATLYTGSVASAYKKLTLTPTVSGIEGTVKFSSSNKKVATVSKTGVVKPVAKGSCTITAYIKTGVKTYKTKCKVTVKNPTLKLTPESLTLKVGENAWMQAKVVPAKSVKWTAKNSKVTITTEGLVTAKQTGTTYVYGKANGIKKKVKVVVTQ
ncbi:MAG: leucine-rich repeat protein [Blautia sp.]|nr:leucine-rich repeat protein [Blautia sp.]